MVRGSNEAISEHLKQTVPSIWVQQETMADAINLVECVLSNSLCCTLKDELFAQLLAGWHC